MYFKKFLKKILLAQISIILTFGVIKTSVANESENFTDYFNSYVGKIYNFNVYFEDNMLFDEIIMDFDASKRIPILAKTVEGKNDVMALMKLECEKKICNVTGSFNFDFDLTGMTWGIEREFEILDYDTVLSSDNLSITDTLFDITNVKLNLEKEAVVWADHTDFFWIVDDPDALSRRQIIVYTEHFSKEEKINLIKTCFNKCKTVSVYGEPFFNDLGVLSLKAIEVKSSE